MDLTQILILAVLGLVGGVLAGLVGVGGGIIFVPALVYAAGWGIKEAVAASLFVIIFASLTGTLRNQRSADPPDWRTTALLTATVAPSALIGVFINNASTPEAVAIAFALLLLALAYPTARGRREPGPGARKIPRPLVLVAGVFIGALSGLVGVGGGVLMVPLMVLGLGLTTKRAVSTSLAVVMFVGLVGAAGYVATGFNDPEDLLALPPIIIGSMVGATLGVRLRDPLPERVLKVGFALFMVVTALRLLADAAL